MSATPDFLRSVEGGMTEEDPWGDVETASEVKPNSWIKVPARGELVMTILSERPTVYHVHWSARRAVWCPGGTNRCALCECGNTRDTRVAVCVMTGQPASVVLIEVSARVGNAFRLQAQVIGRLRGQMWCLSKLDGKQTGSIIAKPLPLTVPSDRLPDGVDPLPHILRQYGLDA